MHHNDPMCDLGVGDGVVQLPGDLPAQQMDGVQGVLDFAAAVSRGDSAVCHHDLLNLSEPVEPVTKGMLFVTRARSLKKFNLPLNFGFYLPI